MTDGGPQHPGTPPTEGRHGGRDGWRRGRCDGAPETATWTDELVREVDGAQYRTGQGPCLDATRHGRAYQIESMAAERRWPRYTPQAVQRGVLASLSLPLLAGGTAIGALNLYARRSFAFDDDTLRLGEAMAGQAAVALANARLYAETRAPARSAGPTRGTRRPC